MSDQYNHHYERDHEIDLESQSSGWGIDRRSFLRLAGFAAAGAVISGCQPGKLQKAIPYLIKPEAITPGLAYWYSSTCHGCSAGCGLLVKNRDGRPIKMEGNPEHPISRGGLCAVGQASALGLYDSYRLKNPIMNGKESSWDVIDEDIVRTLEALKSSSGALRFLSGTISSPTTKKIIGQFLSRFKDAKHVVYDALSSSAILDAHQHTHGARILPRYRFENASVIVSFDADFLGTWISPVEFTRGYRDGRTLEGTPPKLSYHVQFESRLSLTGSNADGRFRVTPKEMGLLMAHLAQRIEQKAGAAKLPGSLPQTSIDEKILIGLSEKMWRARGNSLVVCGENNLELQVLTNYMNYLLGNYGKTIDVDHPSHQRQGNDAQLAELMKEIAAGNVAALFIYGVNPAYDLPNGNHFTEQVKKISLVVSFADRADETASLAHYICPDHHFLESWIDNEPVAGVATITQPTIPALGNTRPLIESLSTWMGNPTASYDLIQAEWKQKIFPRQTTEKNFQIHWDKSVEAGFTRLASGSTRSRSFNSSAIATFDGSKFFTKNAGEISIADGKLALALYPKVALLDGRHAHNPWLQELPDPVSKITWDNYASVSPATAQQLAISEGDVLSITLESLEDGKRTIEFPAQIQPGQHDGVVAIALGYGRKGTDRFTNIGPKWIERKSTTGADGLVGKNAAPFISGDGPYLSYSGSIVSIKKTGAAYPLASTQIHHQLEAPTNVATAGAEHEKIIQRTTIAAFAKDPSAGSYPKEKIYSMWPDEHKYTGHRWGMAIDLNACTGCAACVISCQAENNIPTVGKDEVRRNREMHWMRIDRYYTEHGGDVDVAHQPMLCQQCGQAPCETVCPVLATVHSEEGLNQQIYNRCVGTRYCSNNCPYKIRRFNWFDYPHEDRLQNMALNPDVTVRSRGIMEKCTFCVQRIQEAKIEAKRQGIALKDGEMKTACEQSCPAQAIVFGDSNDPNSRVSKRMKNQRQYKVLEELGVRPSVGYLTLVRHREEEGEKHSG